MKKYIPLLSAAASSILFGFSYFAVKLVLDVVGDDTFRLLSVRFTVAAIIMTALWATGILKLRFRGKDCRILIPCALCSPICYFIFETTALQIIASSQAGLMTSMSPVITMVLAALILAISLLVRQFMRPSPCLPQGLGEKNKKSRKSG